ncbi:MAG: T9SS type A sorting domain-containing protein [Bacteroidales bacterium]|nr:T9SS type A sorting domain-containing protein [Bacteroidales bacterium]
MYTVYVLYATKYDRLYIGFTSDLENRVLSHNLLAKKGSIKENRAINVSTLSKGMYILVIKRNNRIIHRKKIIKS